MTKLQDRRIRVALEFKDSLDEVKKDVEEYLKENNMKISQKEISDREMTRMITKHKKWRVIVKDLKEHFAEDKNEY